jgi:hypothetical protein
MSGVTERSTHFLQSAGARVIAGGPRVLHEREGNGLG